MTIIPTTTAEITFSFRFNPQLNFNIPVELTELNLFGGLLAISPAIPIDFNDPKTSEEAISLYVANAFHIDNGAVRVSIFEDTQAQDHWRIEITLIQSPQFTLGRVFWTGKGEIPTADNRFFQLVADL